MPTASATLDADLLRRDAHPDVAAANELGVAHDPVGRGIEAAADVEPLDDDRAVESPRIDRAIDDHAGPICGGGAGRHAPLAIARQRRGTRVSGRRPRQEILGLGVADVTQVEERRCDTRPSSSTGNRPLDDWPRSPVASGSARHRPWPAARVGCNSSGRAIPEEATAGDLRWVRALAIDTRERHRVRILSAGALDKRSRAVDAVPNATACPRRRPVPMTRDSTLPAPPATLEKRLQDDFTIAAEHAAGGGVMGARKLTLVFQDSFRMDAKWKGACSTTSSRGTSTRSARVAAAAVDRSSAPRFSARPREIRRARTVGGG